MKTRNIAKLLTLLILGVFLTGFGKISEGMKLKLPTKGSGVNGSFVSSVDSHNAGSISYLTRGSSVITAKRMCGDGDVAHYSQTYPEINFIPKDMEKLPVVVGLWIDDNGSNSDNDNKLLTNDNFMALGYGSYDISGSHTISDASRRIYRPNKPQDSGASIEKVINENLRSIVRFAKDSRLSGDRYVHVHLGLFACSEYYGANLTDETAASGINLPSSIEIARSFYYGDVFSKVANIDFSTLDYTLAKNFKISYSAVDVEDLNEKPLSIVFGNDASYLTALGTEVTMSSSNPFVQIADNIMNNWTRPTDTNIADYQASLSGMSDFAEIESLKNAISSPSDRCDSVSSSYSNILSHGDDSSDGVFWEKIPMNYGCRIFAEANPASQFSAIYDSIATNDIEFNARKVELAKVFLKAAAYYEAQEAVKTQYAASKETITCKDPSKSILESVVASIPVKLTVDSNKVYLEIVGRMKHPESLYAIVDYTEYHNDEFYPMFEMTGSRGIESGINLKVGDSPIIVPTDAIQDSLKFEINSRSIGCSENIYCYNKNK